MEDLEKNVHLIDIFYFEDQLLNVHKSYLKEKCFKYSLYTQSTKGELNLEIQQHAIFYD